MSASFEKMLNSKLQITLSNASKIYFPGQVVSGEVELYLKAPTSFSFIITSISGTATIKTRGTEDNPLHDERVRVYFEKVFQFSPISTGTNNKNSLWSEGTHKYHFTYKLPKGIPSSFESPEGHVRYKICAFVDTSEKQNQNLTDMKFFCVNSVLNLNGINKISSPKTVFKHDQLSCLCIHFRTVSVVLSLMKRGFVPGENILINAVIHNGTRTIIPRVEAKLVQRVKYNFKNYSTDLEGTVAEIVRGPVMPAESQIWRNEKLLIPPVVTSQLMSGNLINVDYKLYLTAVQVYHVENIALKIPIIIGNVPLLTDVKCFDTGSGDPPMAVNSLPMPNNEPCHFGPYNVIDFCGPFKYSTNYIPKYSTYSTANVHYEETHV